MSTFSKHLRCSFACLMLGLSTSGVVVFTAGAKQRHAVGESASAIANAQAGQTGLAAVLAGLRRAYTRTQVISIGKAVTRLKPSPRKGLLARDVCLHLEEQQAGFSRSKRPRRVLTMLVTIVT